MFEDFKKAVLNSYTDKKQKNLLSHNLLKPTKAQLRKECLLVLKNRYQKKDDEVIKAFFDPVGKFDNHEQSILKFDLDDFKSLQKFLLGQPNIRKEENIKLLAWLIDFEPRPYIFGATYNTQQDQDLTSENKRQIDVPILNLSTSTVIPWQKIGIILLSILLVLLSIKIFSSSKNVRPQSKSNNNTNLLSDEKQSRTSQANKIGSEKVLDTKSMTVSNKQCMFWTGDHYEPVECSQVLDDTPILALDIQKVKRLKRITRPDTLSRKDISKTWYVKINVDSIEFYTDSGSYPLDSKKRLRPLTSHMLDKYPNGYNIYKRLKSN